MNSLDQAVDLSQHPITKVQWVPLDKVESNSYNPNSQAGPEFRLLYLSIKNDGITQPIVTIYDEIRDKFVIIDGFHRFSVIRLNKDLSDSTGGMVPVVVLKKTLTERMEATIRHNRARGKHSIGGMSSMVFAMLKDGKTDAEVCNSLGMEPDELNRLKHITGFSKLFAKTDYSRAYESEKQISVRKDYEKAHPGT